MGIAITIFNVISIIILGLMLLKGYMSGLWKSLVSFGILIVGMIILFLCLNPISNIIVNSGISEVIQDMINNMLFEGEAVMDPQITEFVLSLVAVIAKTIILIIGTFLLVCVIEPIISLIVNLIIFSKKDSERNKKPIWVRLGGLGVKAVQFFIVMMGLFLPVFALNSLVLTYEETLVENQIIEEESGEIFGILNDFDKTFVKAPVNAINSVFNTKLEINLFSSVSVIKFGENKINLIKEIYNARSIIGLVLCALAFLAPILFAGLYTASAVETTVNTLDAVNDIVKTVE